MDEGLNSLTEREKQALRLLAAGHDAKSVAAHLDLSVHTVNERLRNARRKLGASSSREAARRLARAEQTDPDFSGGAKNLGDKDLGEVGGPGDVRRPAPSQTRRGPLSARWIIGGLAVMLSLAVAALIFTHSATPVAAPSPTPAAPVATATSEAGEAALTWIALLDREQWNDSWTAAGSLFRSQVTQPNWATTVASVRGSVGPVVSRTQTSATPSATLPGLPAGEYEVIQYRTAFRDKPESVETAVLMREDGAWRIIGYFIR